jgi:hypothetical protein
VLNRRSDDFAALVASAVIGGHRPAAPDKQQCKQCALSWSADRQDTVVPSRFYRTE